MSSFLEMKKITKSFNDNVVLNAVDFYAEKGKVSAIIGENGAGKTTLMKILSGLHNPDSGEIYINGESVLIRNPKQAQDLGIAIIYQEIRLFPDLSIVDNIFISREITKKWKVLNLIDWEKECKETQKYIDYFGLDFDPKRLVSSLGMGEQKFVEIIKALSQKARIIVMDEPTSTLTSHEVDLLFKALQEITTLGVAVIYISHKLEEVKRIADFVTVIRDGELIQQCEMKDADMETLIKAMAGKEQGDRYPKLRVKLGSERLKVENLSYSGRLNNINFSVRKGEIIGITGLTGSGRRTLAKVLCGIEGPYDGSITLNDKKHKFMDMQIAMENGLCYVSGQTTDEGLISEMHISENITITNLKRVSDFGFLNIAIEKKKTLDFINRLEIEVDENMLVKNLSGGKQKKVIFAKWLFSNAQVLVIDEPTAGIDVASKIDIYNIINELLLSGATVIMISTDLSELLGMCDRVMVMCNGEIRGTYNVSEITQEKILYLASGGK